MESKLQLYKHYVNETFKEYYVIKNNKIHLLF